MITKKTKNKPRKKETTGPQTISLSFGDGILNRSYTNVGTYKQLRAVRKNPTVALARALLIACIQAGSWNVESDEDVSDEVTSFMEHVLPLREDFLYNAIAFGKVDFGWCGFEKIFKVVDNRIQIEILKPLLHDMTHILVTKHGRFNGYRQNAMGWGVLEPRAGSVGPVSPLDIPVEKCLHVAFDVEAGNYHGMPLLENIRQSQDDWSDCNAGAKRYDLKLAGTHWIVKYPPGTATVDGETVDNGIVAAQVLAAMESSGSVAIPTTTALVLQELMNAEVANLYAWSVELLDDKGKKQANFVDRLKYLDAQKVRGLGLPERSILEGQFGTKAESETQGDWAVINMEQIDKAITAMVNEQLINQLVELNYGSDMVGKIRLVALPLVDEQVGFLREVYQKLTDPDLDVETLRGKLDLPTDVDGNVQPEAKPEVEEDDEKEEE